MNRVTRIVGDYKNKYWWYLNNIDELIHNDLYICISIYLARLNNNIINSKTSLTCFGACGIWRPAQRSLRSAGRTTRCRRMWTIRKTRTPAARQTRWWARRTRRPVWVPPFHSPRWLVPCPPTGIWPGTGTWPPVFTRKITENREKYNRTCTATVKRGHPVIVWPSARGLFCYRYFMNLWH